MMPVSYRHIVVGVPALGESGYTWACQAPNTATEGRTPHGREDRSWHTARPARIGRADAPGDCGPRRACRNVRLAATAGKGARGADPRYGHRPRGQGRHRPAQRHRGDSDLPGSGGGRHGGSAEPGLQGRRVRVLHGRHERQGAHHPGRRGRGGPERGPGLGDGHPRRHGRGGRRQPRGSRSGGRECRDAPTRPDDVALVLHTSGTTSRPKRVPLASTGTSRHPSRTSSRPTTCPTPTCRSA